MLVWFSRCLCFYRNSLQVTIFKTQNRSLILRCINYAGSNTIRVIDENGTNLGLMTKEEAKHVAESKKLKLTEVVKVNSKIQNSVFKLLPNNEPTDNKNKQAPSMKKTKVVPTKELTMKSQIDNNDLKVKARKLQEFLDRDCHVTLKIVKPRHATRLPREAYENLISMLECEVKLMGVPKESDVFFRGIVQKEKKVR